MVKKARNTKKLEEYLEAAVKCIADVGMHQANTYVISKKLGVSQSTFFYYFKNQDEFHEALISHIIMHNHGMVETFLAREGVKSNQKKLEQYLLGNLKWAENNPAHVDVLLFGFLQCGQNQALPDIARRALNGGQERVYNIVTAGFAEQEFKLKLPAKTVAYLIHKGLTGAIINLHLSRGTKGGRGLAYKELMSLCRELLEFE